MVRKLPDGSIHFKLTYWGPSGGGKTTSVDSLYKVTRERESNITPTSDMTKIDMAGGSTLFFDRGVFQVARKKIFFQVYTVAGQPRFRHLRKTVYHGSDGLIFVADSQKELWQENVESLTEMVKIVEAEGHKLIDNLPWIVQLNKIDLVDHPPRGEMEKLLKEYNLIYEMANPLSLWNPLIFETVAIKGDGVVRTFAECARRIMLYHIRGEGNAPV